MSIPITIQLLICCSLCFCFCLFRFSLDRCTVCRTTQVATRSGTMIQKNTAPYRDLTPRKIPIHVTIQMVRKGRSDTGRSHQGMFGRSWKMVVRAETHIGVDPDYLSVEETLNSRRWTHSVLFELCSVWTCTCRLVTSQTTSWVIYPRITGISCSDYNHLANLRNFSVKFISK